MRLPILQLCCRLFFFLAKHHITQVCQHLIQPRFRSLRHLVFPKAIIAVVREKICECDSHTVHELSQRRLTADWLASRESDYSRKSSNVFSDWMPSYIKATRSVLDIFKMAGYFPDSLRISPLLKVQAFQEESSWLLMMAPIYFTETSIRTNPRSATPEKNDIVFVIFISKCVILPVARLKLCGRFNMWFLWQWNFLSASKIQTYTEGAKNTVGTWDGENHKWLKNIA